MFVFLCTVFVYKVTYRCFICVTTGRPKVRVTLVMIPFDMEREYNSSTPWLVVWIYKIVTDLKSTNQSIVRMILYFRLRSPLLSVPPIGCNRSFSEDEKSCVFTTVNSSNENKGSLEWQWFFPVSSLIFPTISLTPFQGDKWYEKLILKLNFSVHVPDILTLNRWPHVF